jgi:ribA/ribD-fused uncharacterized protein
MSQAKPQQQFTFFYSGPFSQWNFSPFVIDGIRYRTAEHYMMWYKDQVFSGGKLADRILATAHPRDAKQLGREVENFDLQIWNGVAKTGVFRGNMAKFTQNPLHMVQLLETHGTTLVEASPTDVVWGVGLAEEDPLIQDPANWRGTNWLGEVLMDVRDAIKFALRWNDDPSAIGEPIVLWTGQIVDGSASLL